MGLMDQMEDDLDGMFATDVFAEEARIGVRTLDVIFDAEYGESFDVAGTSPAIWCRSRDVAALTPGTTIVVRKKKYAASSVEPDGTGITVVRLEEA